MVIQKEIMDELKKKFSGITVQRIYQKIEDIKKKYRIIDRDIAAYALAFENDIKIEKWLDPSIVDKVQTAIHRVPAEIAVGREKKKSNSSSYTTVKFSEPTLNESILPKQITQEALKMAKVYPIIYVFENSIRYVIQKTMEMNHGSDWWNNTVPRKIREKVSSRIADEDKNKWHGKRGAHEIFYTDIEELGDIISNNWQDFEKYFPDQSWIKTTIAKIGTSRNIIAHNNPLSDDDILAVKVHYRQWHNQIKDIKFE